MIIQGDCLKEMRKMEPNSISCIVTDPPYGISFKNKSWDSFSKRKTEDFQTFIQQFGEEALRITKPGGHLLMFGSCKRHHRQTCGIEDAGWEIRDCLMWLFGNGFPKSHNNFGLNGYGTTLKPAYEPIILAMKPCEGTFAQNYQKFGQGGLNIDSCRLETYATAQFIHKPNRGFLFRRFKAYHYSANKPRWPSNILLDEEAANHLDEKTENASRFFYCAKASQSERNHGLDSFPIQQTTDGYIRSNTETGHKFGANPSAEKNTHPTVKPLKLMEHLIKLVMPPNGILLDPFAGSGSTLVAAKKLGANAIGIEKEAEYCEIARARIAAVI